MSAREDLAEDYVLGLLDEREAEEVSARLAAPRDAEDRALAVAIGALRDRMLALDLTAPELPLRPGAWEAVKATLDAPTAGIAPRARVPAAGRGWRLAALASMAAAAVLAVGLAWNTVLAPEPAVLVVLLDQGGAPVALLEAFADNAVQVTPLTGVAPGPAQVLQLWTKPDPAGPPVSVGLLEAAARMVLRGPDLPAPAPGQLYEITVEQAGGSPTGLPTGPVFGVGNAQAPVLN